MSGNASFSRWVMYAQKDYDAARSMSVLHHPAPIEIVCFHCQQSAEKILKAYIIATTGKLDKTHDLESILRQCMVHDGRFGAFSEACASLSAYAVASRYPLDEDWIDEQDMNLALDRAEKILGFTKGLLAEIM